MWPLHVRTWWKNSEFLFPPPSFSDRPDRQFDVFLEHLRFGYNFLNTEEAYATVAMDYARHAAEQGICYAELQINYALLNTWGLDIASVLARINETCRAVHRGPSLRFIIDLPWQFDAATFKTILRRADPLRDLGVCALSMGGDEALARPAEVAPVFRQAREAGLKALCHAGETSPADLARQIVETLRPDRVTHAVAMADWITALGPEAPPIDVCLTSNLKLGVIPSLDAHPLAEWVAAGVPVALSTDDPALFRVTLRQEYQHANVLCPQFFDTWDRVEETWIRAAADQSAARLALAAAKGLRA